MGRRPWIQTDEICLPEALIVNATSESPAIYNLRQFVEPRRTLLQSGVLTGFREYEVAQDTEVYGRVAQRRSRYEKTWIEKGVQKQGAGAKILSFALTPGGWKIASVLWCDDEPVNR